MNITVKDILDISEDKYNELCKDIGERILKLYDLNGYIGVSKTLINLIIVDELMKKLSDNNLNVFPSIYFSNFKLKKDIGNQEKQNNKDVLDIITYILKTDRNTAQNLIKKSYNMWHIDEKMELKKGKILKTFIKLMKEQSILIDEIKKTGKITIVVENKLFKDELINLFYENGIYPDYSFNKDLLKIDLFHLGILFFNNEYNNKGNNELMENLKEIINKNKKNFKSNNEIINLVNKKDLKDILISLSKSFANKILGKAGEDIVELIYNNILNKNIP